jgi:2-dehydro-3-deoxygalactonokinase
MKTSQSLRIVLDWGTTSFRALLVDAEGHVIARTESEEGIQSVPNGDFAGVLQRALVPWRQAHGPLPIYAAGMIGSRNGWVEMPYVSVPADAAALAAQVRRLALPDGGTISFVPGLNDPTAYPYPDVMRGEETQLVGFGLGEDRTVVLPGTHAKWARIEGGAIRRFQTFVTGEIFGTLAKHSFLAKVARKPETPDWAAFARGVAVVCDGPPPGALLSHLFAVRTGWLAGRVDPTEMTDMLSGIVVASEFQEARALGWFAEGEAVAVVGDDDLVEVYRRTGEAFGLRITVGDEDCAVRGCLAIAAVVEGLRGAA